MNAEVFKEHISCPVVARVNLAPVFIELITARVDEIERLMLKTECAMKLSYSGFWTRKHRDTYKELEWLKEKNEEFLAALGHKKKRKAA